MALVTLERFRSLSRLYADERPGGDDAFIPDDDVDVLVNLQLREHYDLMIDARGEPFFETPITLTTTANVATVSLPEGFYRMLSLFVAWSAQELEPLSKLDNIDDRADFAHYIPWQRGTEKAFHVRGGVVELFPTPTAETSLALRYVPAFEDLEADEDTFETVNGGERMIAYRVAADMKTVRGDNAQALLALYQADKERIERIAEERADAHPKRIRDVRYGDARRRSSWRRWGAFE